MRKIIARTWVADLLDIFRDVLLRMGKKVSPLALEEVLEKEGIKKRRSTPEASLARRGTYARAENDGRLPRDPRIERLHNRNPHSVRALGIRLWDVMENEPSLTGEDLARVMGKLSEEVILATFRKDSDVNFFEDNYDQEWPPRNRLGPILSALSDIGTVDAFTVQLIFLKRRLEQQSSLDGIVKSDVTAHRVVAHATFQLSLSVFVSFCRLAVFPPFNRVRQHIYDHLSEHYLRYVIKHPLFNVEMSQKALDHTAEQGQRVLIAAGKLGLVGPGFREQHDLLMKFESFSQSGVLEAMEQAAESITPTEVSMMEPLFDFVQSLGRSDVPPTHPLVLPNPLKSRRSFRIANALGPIDYGPASSPPQNKKTQKRSTSVARSAEPVSVATSGKRDGQLKEVHATAKTGKNDQRNR